MSLPERAIGSRRARQIAGKVEDYWQTQLLPAVTTVWCHHRAYILKAIERPHLVECLMMEVQPATFKPTVVLTCGNLRLVSRFQHKIRKDTTFKRSGFDITAHQGALVYAMMPHFGPDAGLPSGAPPEPAESGSSREGRSYVSAGSTRALEPDQPDATFFDSGATYGSNDALNQGYIDAMPPPRYIPKASFKADNPSKSPSRSSPPRGRAVMAGADMPISPNMPEVSNPKPLSYPISSPGSCGVPIHFNVTAPNGEGERRSATIGGSLSILGHFYYLTTAHQFLLEPPANASSRDVIESDVEDSEYGSDSDTDKGSALSTVVSGAGAMTHDLIKDTRPSFVEGPVIRLVPSLGAGPDTPFAIFRFLTHNGKSLVSMEEDWALLHAEYETRLRPRNVNRIEHNGKMLHISKINSVTKTTTALLIRNNGEHTQVMCSFAQALVSLPGSQRLHQVHRVDGQIRKSTLGRSDVSISFSVLTLCTGAGDSGSWVIDAETGDLLGIIVAKYGDDAGYMLLAKNVVAQIQREMGLEEGEVSLPRGQARFRRRIQSAARFFSTPARREPLLSGSGPQNPGKSRAPPITGEERAMEVGTKAFLNEMNQRLEALASDSTSKDMALRVRELQLDCDRHEDRINRRWWSAGDSIAQLNRDKIKTAIESLEAMRIEEWRGFENHGGR